MNRKARRHLVWAALFGVLTAVLVGVYLNRLQQQAAADQRVPVVVAATPIATGTTITTDMVKVAQWPQSVLFAGVVRSVAEVTGKQAAVDVVAGQPVLSHDVLAPEEVAFGGRVPLGMRLITVSVNEETAVGYRVRPGDIVDVITVYKDDRGIVADLALQTIKVYALGKESPGDGVAEPRTLTLLTTPEQAVLISALAEQKSVRLVLRPVGDGEAHAVAPVVRPGNR